MLRIGLLWHSLVSGNLGVRALTLAQLRILDDALRAAGRRAEIAFFGHPEWGAGAPCPVESDRMSVAETLDLTAASLTRPDRIRAAFRRCDLLIDISEGDSFTDVYGWRRYAKQVLTKRLAIASGRPFILAPQTIGPFRPPKQFPAAGILKRAAAVFARDGLSAAAARDLGRPDVVETTDVAFLLPYEQPPPVQQAAVRVGVNVSGLLYDAEAGAFGLVASYRALTDALLDRMSRDARREVYLIAHVASPPGSPDQDRSVVERLAARHPRVRLAPAFDDPRAAKSFIAGLDFFIGARMHACIAAFSSGVPLMPLAYTRKATGLFGALGYPVVGDLTTTGTDALVAATERAFAERERLRAPLAAGNRRAGARLRPYSDYLAEAVDGR